MSEKRFTRVEFSNGIWGVKDNNTEYEYPSPIDLLDLLNELNDENKELKQENKKLIEEWEFSFRTEMAHHRFAEKELQEKIREKQATIKSKDKQLERLYNYFQDYLKDEMSGNAFSEMWDFVKEDERWEDE